MKKQGSENRDQGSGPDHPGSGSDGDGRKLVRRFAGPLIICLAAFIATTPDLIRGNSCGHDFDFHLASWIDAQAAW